MTISEFIYMGIIKQCHLLWDELILTCWKCSHGAVLLLCVASPVVVCTCLIAESEAFAIDYNKNTFQQSMILLKAQAYAKSHRLNCLQVPV